MLPAGPALHVGSHAHGHVQADSGCARPVNHEVASATTVMYA
jgi:hypothetical protein